MRAGLVDQALAACEAALAAAPGDAFAHAVTGQVHQRRGNTVEAIRSYSAALALDDNRHDARELLGGLLQRTFPVTAPPRDEPIRDAGPFIYVLGSSYARSFATGMLYLPLMMGTSFTLSFLTDDLAAASQAHIEAHLDRIDRRHPVLLAFFESNALTHHQDKAGTHALQRAGKLGSSDDIIVAGANRYGAFLRTAAARYPGLRFLVLNACPQLVREQQHYVELTNPILKRHCDALGIPYIDVWDDLYDPATGLIRESVCTHPGDVHLSKASIGFITGFLSERGLLPAADQPFVWSHMMRFAIGPGEVTRLWTEPHAGATNLVHSRLVAFNAVLERAVAHVIGTLSLDGSSRVLIPHCREGFVPLAISPYLAAQIVGTDPDPARVAMARRLAHFAGRGDIVWQTEAEPVASDVAFLVLHEDDSLADLDAHLESLFRAVTKRLFVLSTHDWQRASVTWARGARQVTMLDLSHRHLEGHWASANLLLAARAQSAAALAA